MNIPQSCPEINEAIDLIKNSIMLIEEVSQKKAQDNKENLDEAVSQLKIVPDTLEKVRAINEQLRKSLK